MQTSTLYNAIKEKWAKVPPENIDKIKDRIALGFDVQEFKTTKHWQTMQKALAKLDKELDNINLFEKLSDSKKDDLFRNMIGRRILLDFINYFDVIIKEGENAERYLEKLLLKEAKHARTKE